jgi:hypothetical protein
MFAAVKKFVVSLFTQTQQLTNATDSTLSDDMYQSVRKIAGPADTKEESLPFETPKWLTCENSGCGISSINPTFPLAISHSAANSEARISPRDEDFIVTGLCNLLKPTQN